MLIKLVTFPFESLLRLRATLFFKNFFPSYFSNKFVISVGNLSLGGTGKTPLVIYLSNFLSEKGIANLVLSRGYKRKSKDIKIITPDLLSQNSIYEIGDEPFLIAKRTTTTIITSKNKYQAIPLINQFNNFKVVIIDDGFQHLQIKRDLDFLIIDDKTINHPFVFPFGHLREPIESIRRAGIIVCYDRINIPKHLLKFFSNKPIISIRKFIKYYIDVNGQEFPISKFPSDSAVLISGLGNNSQFYTTIKQIGIKVINHFRFKDHHWYDKQNIEKIIAKCKNLHCYQILTNEKDFFKLLLFNRLFESAGIKLYSTKLELEIIDGKDYLYEIAKKIKVQCILPTKEK